MTVFGGGGGACVWVGGGVDSDCLCSMSGIFRCVLASGLQSGNSLCDTRWDQLGGSRQCVVVLGGWAGPWVDCLCNMSGIFR
jgi:hypothetical protein